MFSDLICRPGVVLLSLPLLLVVPCGTNHAIADEQDNRRAIEARTQPPQPPVQPKSPPAEEQEPEDAKEESLEDLADKYDSIFDEIDAEKEAAEEQRRQERDRIRRERETERQRAEKERQAKVREQLDRQRRAEAQEREQEQQASHALAQREAELIEDEVVQDLLGRIETARQDADHSLNIVRDWVDSEVALVRQLGVENPTIELAARFEGIKEIDAILDSEGRHAGAMQYLWISGIAGKDDYARVWSELRRQLATGVMQTELRNAPLNPLRILVQVEKRQSSMINLDDPSKSTPAPAFFPDNPTPVLKAPWYCIWRSDVHPRPKRVFAGRGLVRLGLREDTAGHDVPANCAPCTRGKETGRDHLH